MFIFRYPKFDTTRYKIPLWLLVKYVGQFLRYLAESGICDILRVHVTTWHQSQFIRFYRASAILSIYPFVRLSVTFRD